MGEPTGTALGTPTFGRMKLSPPVKKTIDLEGKLIKDGVRKAICDRQNALHLLLNAINRFEPCRMQVANT